MGGGGPTRGKHRWKRHRCRETTRKRGGRERLAGWCAPLTPSSLAGDQSHRACDFKRPNHRRVFLSSCSSYVSWLPPSLPLSLRRDSAGRDAGCSSGWELLFRGPTDVFVEIFVGELRVKGGKGTEHELDASSDLLCQKVHVLTRKATVVPPLPKPWMAPRTGRGAWT